ncbi:hypothetical protein CFC21_052432, partial [Triticum aestivum]
MGHNGIFRNDTCDAYETTAPNCWSHCAAAYISRGIRVEGILRQAADVEEVDRRLCEYEQGRTEFAPGEDAHIIGDCVKHVLRELPSSPVPASCCTVLLEAF